MAEDLNNLPDPLTLSEKDIFNMRKRLPRVHMGHPLQHYKWRLATRLRKIRMSKDGGLSKKVIDQLINESGNICPICGSDMRYWVSRKVKSVDHIISLANGGGNDISNLRVICNICNSRKASKNG